MPEMILLETEESMEERITGLKRELSKVRTGRANPKMLDDVKVEYYGAMTNLNQIGNISVPEPSQLLVKPYDRSIVKDVTRAINAANLGVNPSNEGDQIRIVLPALTTERRKELTKDVKMWPQQMVNIRTYKKEALEDERVLKVIQEVKNILKDDGKVLVRASGTEPLLRVTLSCELQEDLDKYMDMIVSTIKKAAEEK